MTSFQEENGRSVREDKHRKESGRDYKELDHM